MKKSQVAVSTGLGIRVGLGAFPIEKKCVVQRQPPHPQVPIVVGRVLFVVECSSYLQKGIIIQTLIHNIQL